MVLISTGSKCNNQNLSNCICKSNAIPVKIGFLTSNSDCGIILDINQVEFLEMEHFIEIAQKLQEDRPKLLVESKKNLIFKCTFKSDFKITFFSEYNFYSSVEKEEVTAGQYIAQNCQYKTVEGFFSLLHRVAYPHAEQDNNHPPPPLFQVQPHLEQSS